MSYLLNDFDDNMLTTDEDINNICLCVDNNKKLRLENMLLIF